MALKDGGGHILDCRLSAAAGKSNDQRPIYTPQETTAVGSKIAQGLLRILHKKSGGIGKRIEVGLSGNDKTSRTGSHHICEKVMSIKIFTS
jgi:hypothetical protein